MERLIIIGVLVLAGLCEIGDGYFVWGWVREHNSVEFPCSPQTHKCSVEPATFQHSAYLILFGLQILQAVYAHIVLPLVELFTVRY